MVTDGGGIPGLQPRHLEETALLGLTWYFTQAYCTLVNRSLGLGGCTWTCTLLPGLGSPAGVKGKREGSGLRCWGPLYTPSLTCLPLGSHLCQLFSVSSGERSPAHGDSRAPCTSAAWPTPQPRRPPSRSERHGATCSRCWYSRASARSRSPLP